MENYLTEEQLYIRAKKKAKEIRYFYFNLLCYCTVIPILAIINLTFNPEFYWFLFSAGGWGIGVAIHAMIAFEFMPFLGGDWEIRKIKELMEKDQNTVNNNNL